MGGRDTIRPLHPEHVLSRFKSCSDTTQIDGQAIYLGILHNHYGHFLCETLSRLWAIDSVDSHARLVLLVTDAGVPGFVDDFFRMAGLQDRLVYVRTPVCVESLVIPDAAVIYPHLFHPAFLRLTRSVLERTAFLSDNETAPLFVSRGNLVPGYSRYVVGERMLHEAMVRAGATIVSPETLGIAEQIRLFNAHRRIVGYAGSAMHNLLFTTGDKDVLYYSARAIPKIYRLIDKDLRNRARYVDAHLLSCPGMLAFEIGFKPEVLDLPGVVQEISSFLGVELVLEGLDHLAYQKCAVVEFNTASMLRYVVEQRARGSSTLEAEFADLEHSHVFDREMIARSMQRSPVLRKFFGDIGWEKSAHNFSY
ncbi:hypothetical protein DBV39_05020 [Orrella marina]|uniref:Glycosyltransferase 61 catalytic domain-containing protein n=1 Tax=Orrella marina TaxID=2163011 RepID=A0A2R4XH97_9BURK|nr:hypothetical protein DBV39_05020 [Orrella marina]